MRRKDEEEKGNEKQRVEDEKRGLEDVNFL